MCDKNKSLSFNFFLKTEKYVIVNLHVIGQIAYKNINFNKKIKK